MEERRKNKRTEIQSKLVIKSLNNESVSEVSIEITDVSRTGIGFFCKELLEIGTVYESNIMIWTKEVLNVCVEVIRMEKSEDGYSYGGIFIGMSETDASRISVYQTIREQLDE